MQSINPQDQQTTQIQSVDNLVSEIRQIADHIYEEGAQELVQQNGNTHQQNNGEAHSPRTPQYQSVQAPQEPSSHQPEHDALKADAVKQRPPLNPGDISKGLSRLHARVDEVLRRTPQRGLDNSTVFDNLNKPATTGTVRSSLLGETSEAQYRSNVVSIRPEEAYRSSHIVSNYASIPRSSTLPSNTNFAKPPVGTHGQSSSISTTSYPQQQHHYQQQLQHQELPYNNPFSENALLRTGEYDARKSFLQYGVPPATTTSHLTASTVNVAPWNTNIEQIKTQRDDRPFRSPSMLESGIGRGHPAEIGGYNPALRDPRYEHSINSGLGEVHHLSTISTVHGGAPEGGLYQSASVPSFKPRYDRGKLDSIISNIKNREGGSGSASLYQSQAPSVTTSNIYSRVQEPVQHHDIRPSVVVNKQAAFFSGGEPHVPKQTTYESVTRTQQDYLSPSRGLPQATHTPQQQYNQMSSSKFVSPSVQQFSSPQNVIPTSNAYSNPFNQPRHEFETEEAVDYYGVFGQPQREFERERRQGFTPGGEEHLLHHQLLQQQQHYQHMTPNMTPKQDEVGYRRGGGGYPEQVRGFPDQYQHQQQQYQQQQPYRTPEYDRGYPQQQRYREADVYDRYQEPVQDRYNPADRYGSNRQEEFAKRMGPSDIKRGLNRRPDEYAPDVEFGEFQNDDDSLLEDRPPVKAKGRTRKQENPHQFGGLEDDESFVSDRDSFVEQTGPKLRPGRRAASRTRNQNLSHREERPRESGYTDRNMIPKPVTAPRQELVRNTERPSGPSGATRRGSSARGRRAELGGGDLVYSGTGETGNTNSVQRKQSFGQEQGRGGSVPRRGPGAREPAVNQRTEYPTRDRDVQVKEETPMRASRVQGQQQYDSERGYGVRSAGGAGVGSQRRDNPKEYLNNEEELSDFDFENREEVEDNYNRGGRGKASQPAARDEDSVTRAFEHARYDSGRKAQGYNAGRDGVSMKTEVIQGGNAGGRRRVGR